MLQSPCMKLSWFAMAGMVPLFYLFQTELAGRSPALSYLDIPFNEEPAALSETESFPLPSHTDGEKGSFRLPRTDFGGGKELLRSPCFYVEDSFHMSSWPDAVTTYRIFDHGGQGGMRSIDLFFYRDMPDRKKERLFLVRKIPRVAPSSISYLEFRRRIGTALHTEPVLQQESPDGARISLWRKGNRDTILSYSLFPTRKLEIIYRETESWNQSYKACELSSRMRKSKSMEGVDRPYGKSMNEF